MDISIVQIPLSTLSKLLFTSITTECTGSVLPVCRSPKMSSNDENPVHRFEGMESYEMLKFPSEMVQANTVVQFLSGANGNLNCWFVSIHSSSESVWIQNPRFLHQSSGC